MELVQLIPPVVVISDPTPKARVPALSVIEPAVIADPAPKARVPAVKREIEPTEDPGAANVKLPAPVFVRLPAPTMAPL